MLYLGARTGTALGGAQIGSSVYTANSNTLSAALVSKKGLRAKFGF